ncbi:HipA N-terminal domain-containing protein [Poseidonibacter ostreae]|jgi:serine/threonine-protein kinase HipA|uniref:HipA N-terminal subdomain 1 domain-containing protein n=1 Tax=Poseidonibacter ostreae TaxID=2654171 RepID=A0A6L4WNN5_9BACT|nr:HipA N-terminal domain-containing protein [Poseidonibacter ostreae]KAB7884820.1 hypothetical protein GBG19_15225 [Poseidonibacter ostreae]KAB7885840.1 hypothetical protein GA417_07180 [Poseidonibacter ostreae]KAB7887162.1 hypothetical protein GBG18_14235 [Poseidonibacter ostreae]
MNNNKLKVFTNKILAGNLYKENDTYIFNYNENTKDLVSLTMPIRANSWTSKKLHPIFQMNLPEGALKEVIKNHFAKIKKMDDLGFLELIGPYVLGRVKYKEIVEDYEQVNIHN